MIIHEVDQNSDEWYALRVGKPTASEFSKIITSKGEPSKTAPKYAITLAAEMYAGKAVDAWEGNAWTDRGHEMEAEAIRRYEFTHDLDVARTGFVTDDDDTIGASPDGLVGDDGLIEIKCLKAENHIGAILYHQKNGYAPPAYTQQTQGQIMICERAWCDLVFYHPDLPQLVIRQEKVDPLQEALAREIPLLLKERDRVVAALRGDAE